MSLLYLFQDQGTIKGKSNETFDAEMSATKLHTSFKGLSTDEKIIIDTLTSHSNVQRQDICRKYVDLYGRDLITDLKGELGGHFLDTCMALIYPSLMFDVICIRKGLTFSPGPDITCLVDILCTRSNAELKKIKQIYFQENRTMLEKDLGILSNAHVSQILQALADGTRDENVAEDYLIADRDAADLIAAGVSKIGMTGTAFNKVLCRRSRQQLHVTFEAYKKKTGVDLETDIRKEFDGTTLNALLTLIKITTTPIIVYFAEKLNECMKLSDTDDDTLIRILVSRSEIDLEAIKVVYQQKFKSNLTKDVRENCSGDYCRLLLKILGDPI